VRSVLLASVLAMGCARAAPPPPAPAPAPPPARAPVMQPPAPPPPNVVVVERSAPPAESEARGFQVARRMDMRATGYCLRGHMRTGVRTRDGMAATDPSVIPLGSVMRVWRTDGRLVGTFVAMDTGGAIRGNKIDLYMASCSEALDWGIRPVVVEVVAIGWGR
jgi:3D (Asp-Asp-Asp) domain-containing protein